MRNLPWGSALATSTVMTIALASPVHAQSTLADADTVGSSNSQATGGDIIVTAQRREQKLRDVPLSISAFTADQLSQQNIRDTVSLTSTTPGLLIDRTGSFVLPSIRGISTQVTGAGNDTNVAIYIDGVYQPSSTSNAFDFPDVERIEVAKGPQGTLFGRNATGGAIQIFTKEPGYTFGGQLTASYGRFNDRLAKGYVSIPLVTDQLALSIAGLYEDSDGFQRSVTTGKKVAPLRSRLIRTKLLAEPVDDLKILLTGYYSKREDASTTFATMLNGNTVGRAIPGSIILPGQSDPYVVAVNPILPQFITVKSYGGSVDVALRLSAGMLKSVTAFNEYKLDGSNDADNSVQPPGAYGLLYNSPATDKSFSQEVSFASDLDGSLNFVVGGFYIDGWGGYQPINVLTDTAKVSIFSRQDITAYAGFGEVYYDLTDRLQLIGGLRYSWERRSLDSDLFLYHTATRLGGLDTSATRQTWDSFTPRASIKYDITPESNVYFTYSQGFKSGVFNSSATSLQADGSLPVAKPESIKAYEIGFKGRIARVVDLTLSGFHYDYVDVQTNAYACVPLGSPSCVSLSILTNAARARINGLDFDASARLGGGFSLRTGISVLDGKYRRFPGAPVAVPKPTNDGNINTYIDAGGRQMVRAPKFTINVSGNYEIDIAAGTLRANATLYHSSRIPYTIDGRISQAPYTTLDGRISFTPTGSGVTVSVFGRNLTDARYFSSVFATDAGDAVAYAAPWSIGGEISMRF